MYTADRSEEQILIMHAQRGEKDAFHVLVERYQPDVHTFVLCMLGNRNDADSVTQEIFLSVWRALPQLCIYDDFSAWAYLVAVHATRECLRKYGSENVIPDMINHLREGCSDDQPESLGALLQAILALSVNHRYILLLHKVGRLDYHEIGKALAVSDGVVKSRYERAIIELQDKLNSNKSPDCCYDCNALNRLLTAMVDDMNRAHISSSNRTTAIMHAVNETEQDLPFTNLPQKRKNDTEVIKQLHTWWKHIRPWLVFIACLVIILSIIKLVLFLS